METFYTVIEVQNSGTPAILNTVYTNINQALSKYHTVLAVAAVSQIPYHACFILRSDGVLTHSEVYNYKPEPEPEE